MPWQPVAIRSMPRETHNAWRRVLQVWHPRRLQEERAFGPQAMAAALSADEHADLAGRLGQHSQAHP